MMNPDILHPCGRLYLLERSLDAMAQTQLELVEAIDHLAGHPAVSSACQTLTMHAVVMAGQAKRMQELRRHLSKVLP